MSAPLKIIRFGQASKSQQLLDEHLTGLEFSDVIAGPSNFAEAMKDDRWFDHLSPHVVVVDMTGNQQEALKLIKYCSTKCKVIALQASQGEESLHDEFLMIEALKNGAEEYFVYPQDFVSFDKTLQKMYTLSKLAVGNHKLEQQGRVLALFSAKGGSGATTLALNVAYELRRLTTRPVLVIDLNQNYNSLGFMLNIKHQHALGDLAHTSPKDIDEEMLKKLVTHHPGSKLDIVVACKNPLDHNEMLTPPVLDQIFRLAKSHYHYVVIDIPSQTVDSYHQHLIKKSDELYVTTTYDLPAISRTRQYLDIAEKYLNPNRLSLIVNRSTNLGVPGIDHKTLEGYLEYPVSYRVGENAELATEAQSMGRLMVEMESHAPIAKSIREIALGITGMTARSDGRPMDSFLGKLKKFGFKKEDTQHVNIKTGLGI